MNQPEATAPPDSRLAEAVEEYRALLKAGRTPDREAFLARHGDLTASLAECLDALEFVEAAGPQLHSGGDAAALDFAGALPLGDFRILHELGRGGMGVVYEAMQLSLGRRVALKVLPFAAALDAKHLQRFKNEAHAAAQLHHTNIVPVFYVGCERGVHFYAMQFIDGQSLATVITELRRSSEPRPPSEPRPLRSGMGVADETTAYAQLPDGLGSDATLPNARLCTEQSARSQVHFQAVAHLGVQTAEALEHAHQLGVIHRDIKPANLLVDGRGGLWVADFGLAHCQGDAALTMSGDLVGTLRYMSPEQALAQRVAIDHRTDIYSLGVTLYELLTLEPAFNGRDRQELLRQIAFEEPRLPRRMNRAIPAELETIVLKAMEKNPAERYATAQELADDLGRFLRDEPIRAKRPSLLSRLRKWGRRHQAVVASSALSLLVLAVALGGVIGWEIGDRNARRDAGERRAQDALREGEDLLNKEKWSEALSAAGVAEGVLASSGGSDDLVAQAVRMRRDLEMARSLQEARLKRIDFKDDNFDFAATNAAYADAFKAYELDMDKLDPLEAAERVRASPIHRQLIAALEDWAFVGKELNSKAWRRQLTVARMADPDPWRNRLRDALEGRDRQALEDAIKSVTTVDWPPATLVLLGRLAGATALGDRAAALLRRAQQQHPSDFWINYELAMILCQLEPPRPQEVVHYLAIAVALRPDSCGAHLDLGVALSGNGKHDEAVTEVHKALRLAPEGARALVHRNLGFVLRAQGRLAEAIAEFRVAVALDTNNWRDRCYLAAALAEGGDPEEAIAEYQKALALQPWIPVHCEIGKALAKQGKLDAAIPEYRRAIQSDPKDPDAHCALGHALRDQGKFAEALAELKRGHELGSRRQYWRHPSADWVDECERLVEQDAKLAAVLRGDGRPKDAAEWIALAEFCRTYKQFKTTASRFYAEAFAKEPRLASDLESHHRHNAALTAALAGTGHGADVAKLDGRQRAQLRGQALDWLRADLADWRQLLDKEPGQTLPVVQQELQHWQQDGDFAGVRDTEALSKLPEAERKQWQKLWEKVAELAQGATKKK